MLMILCWCLHLNSLHLFSIILIPHICIVSFLLLFDGSQIINDRKTWNFLIILFFWKREAWSAENTWKRLMMREQQNQRDITLHKYFLSGTHFLHFSLLMPHFDSFFPEPKYGKMEIKTTLFFSLHLLLYCCQEKKRRKGHEMNRFSNSLLFDQNRSEKSWSHTDYHLNWSCRSYFRYDISWTDTEMEKAQVEVWTFRYHKKCSTFSQNVQQF